MFIKIKRYFIYRKNIKTIKRELAQTIANTLPLISKATSDAKSIIDFASHIINECGKLNGQELISAIASELANKLETDETRIFQIIQYIFTMDIEDIKKIIINAQIESLDIETDNF